MPHLICYDIEKNGLRKKLADLIIDHGLDRINYSVYLGSPDTVTLRELEDQIGQLMQKRGQPRDSVLVLPVNAQQVHQMRIYGQSDLDSDDLTGNKSTLIL
ncbi:MAG: CRISPR-associated endonuclease Cas2 [Bacteroidota bacterium]